MYNTSSSKGTITNVKGEFKISVRLNDVIEISALQFEKFTVKIDEKILNNRYFTVYLVERINKLDEVIITPYDMLTGNLVVDAESVETFNPDLDAIYFGVNDIYTYEFTDDYKSEVDNPFMKKGELYNGADLVGIFAMVLKPIFQKNKKTKNETKLLGNEDIKEITDVYGMEFLSNTFNIPEDRVEAFVAYVNDNNFDPRLLNENNEVELIEHLFAQSRKFLKTQKNKD